MTVRGLSGFGDAIYLQPIVDRICREKKSGEPIYVYTNYPDVFAHLDNVVCLPYSREAKVDVDASYIDGKSNPDTLQVDDMGYTQEMRRDYITRAKPIVVFCTGYLAMGIIDEMTPLEGDVQKMIDKYIADGYKVLHLANGSKHNYNGAEKITSKSYEHTYALFRGADKIVCQQGWAVALAEGLKTPCTVLYTKRAQNSTHAKKDFITSITPKKIIYRDTTDYVYVS